jgi:hypothetical protein
MNKQLFSRKVASVLNDYSALPFEAKAETLINLKRIIRAVKSKRARKTLREIENFSRRI